MEAEQLKNKLGMGNIVFAVGTISNIVEFTLALTVKQGIMLPLIVMILVDASMIAYYFMHVAQLWRPEE